MQKINSTNLIHPKVDVSKYRLQQSITHSVTPSVAYEFATIESAIQAVKREDNQEYYGRYSNPTTLELEEKVAFLENSESALSVSSGMAAISSAILYCVDAGDHILITKDIYGGTYSFLKNIGRKFHIEFDYIDMTREEVIEEHIKPNTKCVFIETPSNPAVQILNIRRIADVCKAHELKLIVDNTFMTPIFQRPLDNGADMVVHSATKYLNGHGDVLGGIVAADKTIIDDMRRKVMGDLGQNLSSWDAYFIIRGLKTLGIRMEKHEANAKKVAEFLQNHSKVHKVHYPKITEDIKDQMYGTGGIVSFELDTDRENIFTFINALEMLKISYSLGDPETLVQHPSSMTHSAMSLESQSYHGVTEGLIRLSIGLERVEDIIADIDNALHNVRIHSETLSTTV
ncbi:trans-sulfuration enzyme family protein [Oceanobacillus oncorhynchi]|uniref:trans-sulfuration enzyme family protein n=1 Tax=Oceanobacillus oncorhynchi TaxID=545501 RepID=UPI0018689778|nr:PLP-dependent aspartate aminotransferase family protein [Oceanobacillus oncorhynchi]